MAYLLSEVQATVDRFPGWALQIRTVTEMISPETTVDEGIRAPLWQP
jgi:hypothetical protein